MACFAKSTLKQLCWKGEAPLNAISAVFRKASIVGAVPARELSASTERHGLGDTPPSAKPADSMTLPLNSSPAATETRAKDLAGHTEGNRLR
jgi:hypothetical protein